MKLSKEDGNVDVRDRAKTALSNLNGELVAEFASPSSRTIETSPLPGI